MIMIMIMIIFPKSRAHDHVTSLYNPKSGMNHAWLSRKYKSDGSTDDSLYFF